ncbi:hypothetical protein BDZ91DRAFT_729836 [Kalaharituber pfeilii]|nr:hypothetical protein BDZ91DRAFT_729836 [Kalaharituber pfeilii]
MVTESTTPTRYSTPHRALKLLVFQPSKTGPLPTPIASAAVQIINAAFGLHTGSRGVFSGPRIWEGTPQLHLELGAGYALVWTLPNDTEKKGEDEVAAFAAVKPKGRGWRQVPSWEGLHPPNPQLPESYGGGGEVKGVCTKRGEEWMESLAKEDTSLALWEIALVAVQPKLRGLGIGTLMLQDAERFLKELDPGSQLPHAPDAKPASNEKQAILAFVVREVGNDAWYSRSGYETISTLRKPYGFWGCVLENGFSLVTMLKEIK